MQTNSAESVSDFLVALYNNNLTLRHGVTATGARTSREPHGLQLNEICTIFAWIFSRHTAKGAKEVNFSSFSVCQREVRSVLRLTSDGK